MRECPVCHDSFEPIKSHKAYCSKRCRTFAQGARARARSADALKMCRSCLREKPIAHFVEAHVLCRECEERHAAGLKTCRKCTATKPLEEFYFRSYGPSRSRGYDANCKQCQAEISKKRNALPHQRQRKREAKFRLLYGITVDEYDQRLARQKNSCAICGRPATATLHVDHDHKTGKVRDLLCLRCNALLGHCAEDPAILQAAAEYLERHSHDISAGS